MADAILKYLRTSLPNEVADQTVQRLQQLENGEYKTLLASPEARLLLGRGSSNPLKSDSLDDFPAWSDYIFHRVGLRCGDRTDPTIPVNLFLIGYAALLAFVQSNITGPPLPFQPASILLPQQIRNDRHHLAELRRRLLVSLTIDGIAAYRLTPNVELLCLADAIMTCPAVLKHVKAARWAKLRIAFFQQRLLSEVSSTLQDVIYDDLELVEEDLAMSMTRVESMQAEFLMERATIHIHHGLDKFAREDLEKAKQERGFEFALTGLLGKRTKFQTKDISQLVVLAVSSKAQSNNNSNGTSEPIPRDTKPTNLDLNDDTLLESISFSERATQQDLTDLQDADTLPPVLRDLDPSEQPRLDPLDSVILLLLASSITNTSPTDGLTREETLPYAVRVLEGGSSNWQVYTQALLVRSRIEGYKSRTIERGLLQLQALVDQVIAETMVEGSSRKQDASAPVSTSTFLPRGESSESAPVAERMRYVFQLATPTRWELEAELASRWVQMGGLRSALEIYQRLELWAEVALCWAATEQEEKAKRIVRRQLFHATNGELDASEDDPGDDEEWKGPARNPPPMDAPRLYCILGDIDQSVAMYEKAWEVSDQRYARAQRSIGRHFFAAGDMVKAADAYAKSVKVNQLNHQSWFALGCALLELAQFPKAVEAFSRCVQLDETDAEAWSNLAAALLRIEPEDDHQNRDRNEPKLDDEDERTTSARTKAGIDRRQDALKALKRAASLKHDSHRIWENVLIVSASITPPDYATVISAQKRLIDLRGPTIGEKAIDTEILAGLVNHITTSNSIYDPNEPGVARMVVQLVDQSVIPLITASAELWHLVAKLALWRRKPSTALDAEEKAWRAVTSQPGWESSGSNDQWERVVDATVRLCDAYETFGPKERTEGMAAGSGELVMKDWKFKARSAIRGIMGKAKDGFEDTEGWLRLKEVLGGLKG